MVQVRKFDDSHASDYIHASANVCNPNSVTGSRVEDSNVCTNLLRDAINILDNEIEADNAENANIEQVTLKVDSCKYIICADYESKENAVNIKTIVSYKCLRKAILEDPECAAYFHKIWSKVKTMSCSDTPGLLLSQITSTLNNLYQYKTLMSDFPQGTEIASEFIKSNLVKMLCNWQQTVIYKSRNKDGAIKIYIDDLLSNIKSSKKNGILKYELAIKEAVCDYNLKLRNCEEYRNMFFDGQYVKYKKSICDKLIYDMITYGITDIDGSTYYNNCCASKKLNDQSVYKLTGTLNEQCHCIGHDAYSLYRTLCRDYYRRSEKKLKNEWWEVNKYKYILNWFKPEYQEAKVMYKNKTQRYAEEYDQHLKKFQKLDYLIQLNGFLSEQNYHIKKHAETEFKKIIALNPNVDYQKWSTIWWDNNKRKYMLNKLAHIVHDEQLHHVIKSLDGNISF